MPKRKPREELRFQLPKLPDISTMPRLPVVPRGPRVLRTELNPPQVFESNAPPPPPGDFNGTLPEWRVVYWLTKHGYEPDFQSSLEGGRAVLGGLVADVILHELTPPLVIQVQGTFWHYFGPFADPQKDQRQKNQLENMGYRVAYADEDDILNRLDYTMEQILRGIDISRGAWSR